MTNFVTNPGAGGLTFTSDTEAGAEVPASKLWFGTAGAGMRVTYATPLPTTSSASQTDGAPYTTLTSPQVNVMGGKGVDGSAHSVMTDRLGNLLLSPDQADIPARALLEALVQEMACIRMAMNSLANTQFHPSNIDITNR